MDVGWSFPILSSSKALIPSEIAALFNWYGYSLFKASHCTYSHYIFIYYMYLQHREWMMISVEELVTCNAKINIFKMNLQINN